MGNEVYEYNPEIKENKIIIQAYSNITYGAILNNKLYFNTNDKVVYEYDPNNLQSKILDVNNVLNNNLNTYAFLNNKLYFKSNDGKKIYEYDSTNNQNKIIINSDEEINFLSILDNKLYFKSNSDKLYEYDLVIKKHELLILKLTTLVLFLF